MAGQEDTQILSGQLRTRFPVAHDTGVQQGSLIARRSIFVLSMATKSRPEQPAAMLYRGAVHLAVKTPNVWNKLPPEIVSYIFQIAVKNEPDRLVNLLLSLVCAHWRAIVVLDPTLWGDVTLTQHDPQCRWFELCVTRAKSCPLDISLPSTTGLSVERMSKLMDILIPRVDQWRRFDLEADHPAMRLFLERFASCERASNLEVFSVRRTTSDNENDTENRLVPMAPPVGMAPKLRSLTLSSVSMVWNRFPFTDLTHLELINHRPENQLSLNEFVTILSRCPELETLVLNGSGPFRVMEELRTYSRPIDLPSLRVLEILHQTSREGIQCLGRLLRPTHLQSLTLAEWRGDEYDDVIASFGTLGLYHSITSLRIGGIEASIVTFGAPAFFELFKGTPKVQHLTIELHGMNPVSLTGLSDPRPDFPIVLPHLHTVKISGSHRDCVSSMVGKRKHVNMPVRHLILEKTDRVFSEAFLEILRNSVEVIEYIEQWDPHEGACPGSEYGDDDEDEDEEWDPESDHSTDGPQFTENDEHNASLSDDSQFSDDFNN